jgi:alpha-aminoadipic semialdehyde synthase
MIVNGIYWEPHYPRLLTLSYMKQFYEFNPNPKLRVIADISCDIEGSIELTTKATSSENPVYVFEPITNIIKDGVEGFGPVILAQDRLPVELPREASQSFGNSLLPFIPQLALADYTKPRLELDIPKVFKKAVITHQGELAKRYHHLHAYVDDIKL